MNAAEARRFSLFLRSPETQRLIRDFGKDRFGQPLFHVWPRKDTQPPVHGSWPLISR